MLQTKPLGAQDQGGWSQRKEGPHGAGETTRDGCPSNFLFTMSHCENNGQALYLGKMVQLQLGEGCVCRVYM